MIAVTEAAAAGPVTDWLGVAAVVTAILGGMTGVAAAILRSRDHTDDAYPALVGDLRQQLANERTDRETEVMTLTQRLDRVEHALVRAQEAEERCSQRLAEERRGRAILARRLQQIADRVDGRDEDDHGAGPRDDHPEAFDRT